MRMRFVVLPVLIQSMQRNVFVYESKIPTTFSRLTIQIVACLEFPYEVSNLFPENVIKMPSSYNEGYVFLPISIFVINTYNILESS